MVGPTSAYTGQYVYGTNLNGNYGGCVFLQDCERVRIRNVIARNYNGDGFSWQICHDVIVEDCQSLDNADLGLHPGSGSQRPTIRNNTIRSCAIGLFWCWGVCDGRAESCRLIGNRKFGTSIGHRDTDNQLIDCIIEDNGEAGVVLRPEPEPTWTPDRNRLERCRIRNNAKAGVDIRCAASGLGIVACEFESSVPGRQPVAVRIGGDAGEVHLADNVFRGTATDVEDCREKQNAGS
jgi:hypothetical protein